MCHARFRKKKRRRFVSWFDYCPRRISGQWGEVSYLLEISVAGRKKPRECDSSFRVSISPPHSTEIFTSINLRWPFFPIDLSVSNIPHIPLVYLDRRHSLLLLQGICCSAVHTLAPTLTSPIILARLGYLDYKPPSIISYFKLELLVLY